MVHILPLRPSHDERWRAFSPCQRRANGCHFLRNMRNCPLPVSPSADRDLLLRIGEAGTGTIEIGPGEHVWFYADAVAAGLPDDDVPLREGGAGARAYAEAVSVYLAFAVDKLADRNSTLTPWAISREHPRNTFAMQTMSMSWDFAESNCFSDSSGNYMGGIRTISNILDKISGDLFGYAHQQDVTLLQNTYHNQVISTDPPYYDNIGCLLYTSPSPRDLSTSRMPSSA